MGFANGFNVGYRTGADAKDRWKKGKMADELSAMDTEAEAVKGTGLRVTDAQGNVTEGVGGDLDATQMAEVTKAYEAQGYKVENTGDKYAARSGQGKDWGGAYATEQEAESASRKTNYGLTRKRADVYTKYGEDEMARGLRRDAQAMRLQDAHEDRAAASHAQSMELGGLQINRERAAEADRQKLEMFHADAAQLEAQGALKSPEQWRELAAQHGLSVSQQWDVIGKKIGIDTQMAQDMQRRQLDAAQTAWRKGGLGGLIEEYNNNPMFGDGDTFQLRDGKNGVEVVNKAGRVVAQGATEDEVGAFMLSRLKDPIASLQLTMSIGKHNMEMRKGEATIRSADASAARDQAAAGLARRTDPNNRAAVGDDTKMITRLQAQQAHYRQQYDTAMTRMQEFPEGSKERAAAAAQVNAAGTKLHAVEQSLDQALGGGQSGGAEGGMQDVIVNGKTIGQAGSAAEAQKMAAEFLAAQGNKPPADAKDAAYRRRLPGIVR